MTDFDFLKQKAFETRKETLNLAKISSGFRLASSLSSVEIFIALYYGGILKFNSKNPKLEERDRLIISKGHGSISLYPILADLGFLTKLNLKNISTRFFFWGIFQIREFPVLKQLMAPLAMDWESPAEWL